jgi:transposase
MLKPRAYQPPTELDLIIFDATVPHDHYLRRVLHAVDFERCRPLMAPTYDPDRGRPACEPLLLLKLEFLQYQYSLSDQRVIEQSHYNMAFRLFLGLSLHSDLPDPSLLTYFRRRLGADKHQQVFDNIVGQAREKGLVKDRLRLKDATHVLANIAIPSTIALVSQTRERLLAAAEPLAAQRVADERRHAEGIHAATADLADEERLLQRVAHLRAITAWADELLPRETEAAAGVQQQALTEALGLAHKVLADRDNPKAPDKTVSMHDPEARMGKHGVWYTGYLLDVSMDADSEIITAVKVLPANGNEGADVVPLIIQEEQAHGNHVAAVSTDGAGFQGSVLRELTDPAGLGMEAFVPPPAVPSTKFFTTEQFTLDATGTTLTCPAGQTTQRRGRSAPDSGWNYRFVRTQCAACPLLKQCMARLPKITGRTVIKNDYEAEYRAVRAKAGTAAYEAVRRMHPKVERKLGELVRWHGGRRARYRGRGRVLLQELLTALAVNVKRVVSLVRGPVPGAESGGTVRAGWVGLG